MGARWVAIALGLALVFSLALPAGLVVHLGTPTARRVACRLTNALLAGLFVGRIEVEAVDELALGAVKLRKVRIFASDGTELLTAEGLRARATWWPELSAWWLAGREARVRIGRA